MTVSEAKDTFDLKYTEASVNESINDVVYRFYKRSNAKYVRVTVLLNSRFDVYDLVPGDKILLFRESDIEKINEF